MPHASDYVMLKGGLSMPVAPVLLLLDLEARGLHVDRDGDDLTVSPGDQLTDTDCREIRRWKVHLLALVDYEPETVQ